MNVAACLLLTGCGTMARGTDMVSGLFGADGDRHEDGRQIVVASRAWQGTPAELVGMTDHEVEAIFGSASYIRHEPPAAVWQYRHADCFVDLFLYTDENSAVPGPRGPHRVAHVEMRPLEAGANFGEGDRRACFDRLGRG